MIDPNQYRDKYLQARNKALAGAYEALKVLEKRHGYAGDEYEDVVHNAIVNFMTEGWDPAKESFEYALVKYLKRADKAHSMRRYRANKRLRPDGILERAVAPDHIPAVEARLDVERLLGVLTDRQREVIRGLFLEDKPLAELGHAGAKYTDPVTRCAQRGLRRMSDAAKGGNE